MPKRHDLVLVARHLRDKLNGRAFLTIRRMEVTEKLREVSGEDTTRIKPRMATDLEAVLLEHGVRCYPRLAETTTRDTIRMFHANSVLGHLLDLLLHPSTEEDREVAAVISKIKGRWRWEPGPEASPT